MGFLQWRKLACLGVVSAFVSFAPLGGAFAANIDTAAVKVASHQEASRLSLLSKTLIQPAVRDRTKLKRDARWSSYFRVPIVSFKRGQVCGPTALGCVFGLRPPIYVREDVLARANKQFRLRATSGRPSVAERRSALEGMNVLLHEWAHAKWRIRDEALADCWAGQWLWDFENEELFARSKIELHQKYTWDFYEAMVAVGSSYGSAECYDAWSTAPDLYTGEETARIDDRGISIPPGAIGEPPPPEEPPPPPPAATFAVARAHVSSTHFGTQLWTAGPVKQRVYLNLTYATTSQAGHSVAVQWFRPDGRPWTTNDTYSIEPGYIGSSYWTEIGSDALAPMAGTWRVRFVLDGGRQSGEYTFNVERMATPISVTGIQFGASVNVQWRALQEMTPTDALRVQAFTPRGGLYLDYTWTSLHLLPSGSWPFYFSSYLYGSGYWTIRILLNGSQVWAAQAYVP